MDELSIAEARRIALAAQGFADPAPRGRVDRRHLRRVMRRVGLLQLDAVPVVVRSQYLPAFSRLGPYRTTLHDEIAYRDDEWFEAWSHEASLLPVEREPELRFMKDRARTGGTWKGLVAFAADHPDYVADVARQVAERGPLRASELDDPRPVTGQWWEGRSGGRTALDWLFRIGVVGIRRTPSFEKVYDLLDRIVPASIRALPTPDPSDARRGLLTRAAAAHGVATAADLADYFRLPARESRTALEELVQDGALRPVRVEGWRQVAYLHPAARCPRRIDRTALLSPFDPVVWRRDRARRLFDFDYRLEIYTPRARRVHGYYVLPLLVGDRLVARVDVRTDRRAGVLRALQVTLEDHAAEAETLAELDDALAALGTLVGAPTVERARTLQRTRCR